jgi:hypothetical protein
VKLPAALLGLLSLAGIVMTLTGYTHPTTNGAVVAYLTIAALAFVIWRQDQRLVRLRRENAALRRRPEQLPPQPEGTFWCAGCHQDVPLSEFRKHD